MKENNYDNDGVLLNIEEGDWIMLHSGLLKYIKFLDQLEDLDGAEVQRFATKDEINVAVYNLIVNNNLIIHRLTYLRGYLYTILPSQTGANLEDMREIIVTLGEDIKRLTKNQL